MRNPNPHLCLLLLLATLVGFPAIAAADVIPEGYHGVRHDILISGMEAFSDWVFVLAPTAIGEGAHVVEADVPLHFYYQLDPRVYAVPAGELPEDLARIPESFFADNPFPRSTITLSVTASLPHRDPTEWIITEYRIKSVDGEAGIQLELIDEVRMTADGTPVTAADRFVASPWPWVMVAVAVLLVVLVFVWKARRRREGEASPESPEKPAAEEKGKEEEGGEANAQ